MLIAEIGLNHLGLKKNLSNYLLGLKKSNIKAVTIQIREEKFYNVQKKFFLKDKIYKFFFLKQKKILRLVLLCLIIIKSCLLISVMLILSKY